MISYTLTCEDGHQFDSWFQSAAAFDTLHAAGHLSCAICGTSSVQKAMMAPSVRPARKVADASRPVPCPPEPAAPTAEAEMPEKMRAALQDMKEHVEANSDYVGTKFADQARAMHLGDAPERAIYGEANREDAKALLEDGVPVIPLPFVPTKKVN